MFYSSEGFMGGQILSMSFYLKTPMDVKKISRRNSHVQCEYTLKSIRHRKVFSKDT